ncbi:MAG: NUDIX hydrolase [Candidatus Hydrogenedentes bacterium]|nr:NUDIX hydrolase [Candidatus Hydrogenedentota bacterium]
MNADESWYVRIEGLPERVSSGGVVIRVERGLLLVCLVRETGVDGYVIPKGGIEPGEDLESAALREIEEESGLTQLSRLAHLDTLERLSEKKDTWSINHYGLYLTAQVSGTILDTDHHFDPAWFPLHELPDMFWPDERKMISSRRSGIVDLVIAAQNPNKRKERFM